jgi:DNA polymerase-4
MYPSQRIKGLTVLPLGLLWTAAVTGIREIGEIAALSEGSALALFGKQGPLLRSLALGIDGSRIEGNGGEKRITQQGKRLYVPDRDIAAAGVRIYREAAARRIRVRSVGLLLEGLIPLGYEANLFEVEGEDRMRRLQAAVDGIQGRYGVGSVCRGLVLAASAVQGGKGLLTGAAQG